MQFQELEQIEAFSGWTNIQPVRRRTEEGEEQQQDPHTGFQSEPTHQNAEKAYFATGPGGERLLIRTMPVRFYNMVKETATFTHRLINEAGVLTAEPREVGACCDDTLAYSVYQWKDGMNLSDLLEKLSTPEKFQCGVNAGELLRRVHAIEADHKCAETDMPLKRAAALMSAFRKSGISFAGSDEALAAVDRELRLGENSILADRPYTAVFGDFCVDRIFAGVTGKLGVKPLHRAEYGDPASDLAPVFKNNCSSFMRGQLKGYFQNDFSGDSFGLIFIYAAMYALRAALRDQNGEGIKLAEKISRDYKGFSLKIPAWY